MSTSTYDVGKRLVELCQKNQFEQAVDELYSPNIVSIEPHGTPDMPARKEGMAAIKGKGEWWKANHEVHRCEVTGPWPHGDKFIVRFQFDVTGKAGPMAGKRMLLDETGLYTVKNGKVVQEEFFYHMGM